MNQADMYVLCPFNRHHIVKKYRLLNHMSKCREKHQDMSMETCKFNHHHLFKREEDMLNCQGCPAQLRCQTGSEDDYLKFGEESDEEFYKKFENYRRAEAAAKNESKMGKDENNMGKDETKVGKDETKMGNDENNMGKDNNGCDSKENAAEKSSAEERPKNEERTRKPRKSGQVKKSQNQQSRNSSEHASQSKVPSQEQATGASSTSDKKTPFQKNATAESSSFKKRTQSQKNATTENSTSGNNTRTKNIRKPNAKPGGNNGLTTDGAKKTTLAVPQFRRSRPRQSRRHEDVFYHYATKRVWRRGESPPQSELDREEALIQERENRARHFKMLPPSKETKNPEATDPEATEAGPSTSNDEGSEKKARPQKARHVVWSRLSKYYGVKLNDEDSDSEKVTPQNASATENPDNADLVASPSSTHQQAFLKDEGANQEPPKDQEKKQEGENRNILSRFNPFSLPSNILRAFSP